MSEFELHEILICSNPECGLRFPLSPTERRLDRCPRCGSPVRPAEIPYRSFSVPIKAVKRKENEYVSILDNIRSTYNVGSIFRTSDGAGIDKLFLCGITPTPENPKVGKTALGAEKSVKWEHRWSVLETAEHLQSEGFFILALEGGSTSVNIFDALHMIRSMKRPLALAVGNEVSGIDPEVVNMSDMCIYIPMEGIKESLNVATAFGIAAYMIRYRETDNE